jgi:hypothetical protein
MRSRTTPGRKLPSKNKIVLEPTDKPPDTGTVTTICRETEPAIEKSREIEETIASKSKRLRQFHFAMSLLRRILSRRHNQQ